MTATGATEIESAGSTSNVTPVARARRSPVRFIRAPVPGQVILGAPRRGCTGREFLLTQAQAEPYCRPYKRVRASPPARDC